jgi:uncharacterized membrane protein
MDGIMMFADKENKIIIFAIFAIISLSILIHNSNNNYTVTAADIQSNNSFSERVDKFGIKEIYPTKPGGREWFVNMDEPRSDGLFFITSYENIRIFCI